MTDVRTLSEKNKYCLPKEVALTVYHYCRAYPEWKKVLKQPSMQSVRYDGVKVQTSGMTDCVAEAAMERAQVSRRLDVIDKALAKVCPDMAADWIRKNICYGVTYPELEGQGVPMCRDTFYTYRRKAYYEIAQNI